MTVVGTVVATVDLVIRVSTLSLRDRTVAVCVPPKVNLVGACRHERTSDRGVMDFVVPVGLRVRIEDEVRHLGESPSSVYAIGSLRRLELARRLSHKLRIASSCTSNLRICGPQGLAIHLFRFRKPMIL